MRTDPSHFIKPLEAALKRFEAGTNLLRSADGMLRVETKEGPLAYVEAIEFLRD